MTRLLTPLTRCSTILLLIFITGCAISEDQEIKMGIQAAPQFEKEFGGIVRDAALQRYVNDVGMSMVRYTGREDLPWEFKVLNSKQINAFALPGGKVYITRGMLDQLQNEAQLASILGHEAGHVAHKHSVQQLERAQLLQGGAAIAGLFGGGGVGDITQLVGGLAMMKYGRDQEKDADLAGLDYMVREGYDPRASVQTMEILQKASGGKSQPEFLSTHPNPGNREQYLSDEIEQKYGRRSRGKTDTDEFNRIVRRRR
jgi:predicted Zn-dependent protease